MRVQGPHNIRHPIVACAVCLWSIGIGYDRISRLTKIISKAQIAHHIARSKKNGTLPKRNGFTKIYLSSFNPKPTPITPDQRLAKRLQNKTYRRQVKYLRRSVWRWLFIYKTSPTTVAIVGCSKPHFKRHIEAQFSKAMSWDNYGTHWELDHIIPCRLFNLSDPTDVKRCFHYSNYQPMRTSANRSKSNKNPHPQPELPMRLM